MGQVRRTAEGLREAGDSRPMRYDREDAFIFVGDDSQISVHNTDR